MSSIEEIKAKILAEAEKFKSQKEKEKEDSKKPQKQERDLTLAKNWQRRYIETKKKNGSVQMAIFMNSENTQNIDKDIVAKAKKGIKYSRSDLLNEIVEYYYKNKEQTND